MTVAPPPFPAGPHLSEENLLQMAAARIALRKVRRAISVATFDGWTIGAFAALSILCSLTDVPGLLMGLGMAAVAVVELRGAGRLRRLDPQAARALGFNQLALGTLLVIYSIWRICMVMKGKGADEVLGSSDPQLAQMLGPVENLTRLISLAIYGALIAISLFAQGGLALFYFTRGKHVRSYLVQTPAWIIDMQKAGISV